MFLSSVLGKKLAGLVPAGPSRRRPPRRGGRGKRLRLECLEGRSLLSTVSAGFDPAIPGLFGPAETGTPPPFMGPPAPGIDPQGQAAQPTSGHTDPNLKLGPGDLVIISPKFPGSDPGATEFDKKYEEFEERSRDPLGGYFLSPVRPDTVADLGKAISDAARVHGGPFRRIVIIGHAHGEEDGPAVQLGSERLTVDNLDPGVAGKITGALTSTGICVLASCGYYYERIDNSHKFLGPQTDTYREKWEERLAGMAEAINRPVHADPALSQPSLMFGSDRQLPSNRLPVERIGFDPDGNRLP